MKKFSDIIKKENNNAFVILKPGFLDKEKTWIDALQNDGWKIIQRERKHLDIDTAKKLYEMHKDKDFYLDLCEYMSSDECVCCTCYKNCKDPIKEMSKLKDNIRDLWGKSEMKNAMHSSDSMENVRRETKIIFKN